MVSSKKLLEELSNARGTPGSEGEIRDIIIRRLKKKADFTHDNLGSVICRKKGGENSPTIMLAGHMDEVGFMVRHVTKDGYVKFLNLGGWWGHVLLAQQVIIKTAQGDVPGVIGAKPVHHLKPMERRKLVQINDMFVDVGARDKKEAEEEFGILPGDHITPDTRFKPLKNPRMVSGKAFDNRVGVALFVDAINRLGAKSHPNAIYGVGTAQEEVGVRGAVTASETVNPDVAIVLEGPPADDFPGSNGDENQGVAGLGPQIRLFDPTMIPNKRLTRFVLKVARELGILHQPAVRVSGGTDAKAIHLHGRGVPTIVLGVPVRYAHSHVGVINMDDYEATLSLLMELLKKMDGETVASFTDY